VCEDLEQDGCTGRGTNCVFRTDDCKNTYTFSTTFTKDGATAEGVMTMNITCQDGSGCVGTFKTSYERQD
jgi:hypothetical protein